MEWKIAYADHDVCCGRDICSIADITAAGFETIPAKVPGNFELDLMREGKLEDLYFSTNTLKAQELESVHVWYYTVINVQKPSQYLHFEGIDTFADIYVNRKLVKSTDNMYLSYDVHTDWRIGENEIVIHIRPVMLETRKHVSPVACNTTKYTYPSLYARKAAHMFGWDIMPRIVSAGIWKDVILRDAKPDCIKEVCFVTNKSANKKSSRN